MLRHVRFLSTCIRATSQVNRNKLTPVLTQVRATHHNHSTTPDLRFTGADNDRTPIHKRVTLDHQSVSELYDRYNNTQDPSVKQSIVNELIREVALHSVAEETVLYREIERLNPNNKGKQEADTLRHEHAYVKEGLYLIDHMKVGDPGFDDKLGRVVKTFKEHAQHEETFDLPFMERTLSLSELQDLGEEFGRVKRMAPTRPHPGAPDKPSILEKVVGAATAPIDKMRDVTKEFAERKVPEE